MAEQKLTTYTTGLTWTRFDPEYHLDTHYLGETGLFVVRVDPDIEDVVWGALMIDAVRGTVLVAGDGSYESQDILWFCLDFDIELPKQITAFRKDSGTVPDIRPREPVKPIEGDPYDQTPEKIAVRFPENHYTGSSVPMDTEHDRLPPAVNPPGILEFLSDTGVRQPAPVGGVTRAELLSLYDRLEKLERRAKKEIKAMNKTVKKLRQK